MIRAAVLFLAVLGLATAQVIPLGYTLTPQIPLTASVPVMANVPVAVGACGCGCANLPVTVGACGCGCANLPVTCGCGCGCAGPLFPACGCCDQCCTAQVAMVSPACGCEIEVPAVIPSCGCVPPCTCLSVDPVTASLGSLPLISSCGCCNCNSCGYVSTCGCGCPTLPPLPPTIGCCGKYLRQVCIQPPFL